MALPCEASLFAHLSQARHEQVLGIMAGLAAMQPRLSYTRHILFAPIAPTTTAADSQTLQKKTKTVVQRPQVYTQLVADLAPTDFGRPLPLSDPRWVARTQQTPDPEFADPIVRRVDTAVPDLVALSDTAQFRRAGEYILETQAVVLRDVVLSLQRVLVYSSNDPRSEVPALKDCKLLDASGAFMVDATVRIADRTRPALVSAAVEQLNAVRAELRGVVPLRAPERLSMDARVRAVRT